jgi:Holliday junction resolvase
MLEGEFTRKLKSALERRAQSWVVVKHCDRFSRGIPDLSVSQGSMTLWIEVKMDPEMPTKIQGYYLRKLHHGGALVCASHDGKMAMFTNPYPNGTSHFVSFETLVEMITRWF